MKAFQDVLDEARRRMAANRFTPKVKCAICFGTGSVHIAPIFNDAGTAEIVRQPCQRCGGTGERCEW